MSNTLIIIASAAPNTQNGSAPVSTLSENDTAFESQKKTPMVGSLQAYNLPEEDWQTSNLSFVVVGASGTLVGQNKELFAICPDHRN